MANVEYPHSVIEDAMENLVGVPHECRHMHARPLNHGRPTFGVLPYLRNDFSDANLDGRGYHFAERPAVCGNFIPPEWQRWGEPRIGCWLWDCPVGGRHPDGPTACP